MTNLLNILCFFRRKGEILEFVVEYTVMILGERIKQWRESKRPSKD